MGTIRPSVDVVIPFRGCEGALAAVLERVAVLELAPDDSAIVVDNRRQAHDRPGVLAAPQQRSSYFARNRGAATGAAEWIAFLDADVRFPADLIERYFDPPPAARTAVLAGAVADEPPVPGDPLAVRFNHARGAMSQEVTLGHGRWAFAQTANCAVRRSAFAAVGGFRERIRSGGDADLCFRLHDAGWGLERRNRALAVHATRRTVGALLAQRARHGSGAGWLAHQHPGALPAMAWLDLVRWSARGALAAGRALATGDRERAQIELLDPACGWAFRLGRLAPNRPPRR